MRYGVNGDPLGEGKLDLPELLEAPTPDEWAWARDFVARRSWREASTYRETAPHEYVVRDWETDQQGNRDFDRFITAIRRFGYADYFYQVRHIYWVIDEFKYWTMGWPVEETTVINRAHVDAPEPWKKDSSRTRPTLLGYLAQFASFSKQSEVLCTQGLAYLLQTHRGARSLLADAVNVRTGVSIGNGLTWLPEALQKDGGRPDLEARTSSELPMIKIEAKMGAKLFPSQLRSYEADLRDRNSGDSVLLVLVPKWQVATVREVIVGTFTLPENEPWRVTEGRPSGSVVLSIITWNELFAVLRRCDDKRFRHELEQLEAMYHVLSGDFIAPLASAEDLEQWESHEEDFLAIVDRATRRLTTQHSVYPMGPETLDGESHNGAPIKYRRRYVCPCTFDIESCFAIGVRHSFAKWLTPIWMRFHSDTGDFERIQKNIESSSVECLPSGRHLWIPLHLPFNASGEEMIQAVVDQAEEVLWVAYGAA